MLRTPRQNKNERELAAQIIYVKGAIFAPAKKNTSFGDNRDELVKVTALKNLDDQAIAKEEVYLKTSQGLRP